MLSQVDSPAHSCSLLSAQSRLQRPNPVSKPRRYKLGWKVGCVRGACPRARKLLIPTPPIPTSAVSLRRRKAKPKSIRSTSRRKFSLPNPQKLPSPSRPPQPRPGNSAHKGEFMSLFAYFTNKFVTYLKAPSYCSQHLLPHPHFYPTPGRAEQKHLNLSLSPLFLCVSSGSSSTKAFLLPWAQVRRGLKGAQVGRSKFGRWS